MVGSFRQQPLRPCNRQSPLQLLFPARHSLMDAGCQMVHFSAGERKARRNDGEWKLRVGVDYWPDWVSLFGVIPSPCFSLLAHRLASPSPSCQPPQRLIATAFFEREMGSACLLSSRSCPKLHSLSDVGLRFVGSRSSPARVQSPPNRRYVLALFSTEMTYIHAVFHFSTSTSGRFNPCEE